MLTGSSSPHSCASVPGWAFIVSMCVTATWAQQPDAGYASPALRGSAVVSGGNASAVDAMQITARLGAQSQWRPSCQVHADCFVDGRAAHSTYCDRDHGCAPHSCRNRADSIDGACPWDVCTAHQDCYGAGKTATTTYCDVDHGCAPHTCRNRADSINGKCPWEECHVHTDCYANGKDADDTYCDVGHGCAPRSCANPQDSVNGKCPWEECNVHQDCFHGAFVGSSGRAYKRSWLNTYCKSDHTCARGSCSNPDDGIHSKCPWGPW
jgi:hypothetical protein